MFQKMTFSIIDHYWSICPYYSLFWLEEEWWVVLFLLSNYLCASEINPQLYWFDGYYNSCNHLLLFPFYVVSLPLFHRLIREILLAVFLLLSPFISFTFYCRSICLLFLQFTLMHISSVIRDRTIHGHIAGDFHRFPKFNVCIEFSTCLLVWLFCARGDALYLVFQRNPQPTL